MIQHHTRHTGLARLAMFIGLMLFLSSHPASARPWVEPETFTLDNGLQVVVLPDHRAPVVTHMVWYRVGAADEPPGKSGIAHFLEHLMFKGTDKIAPGEFSKIVARMGGQDNAFTSQDYTAYFQRIALAQLPKVMAMEADRMANLKLSEDVVGPERDVVLEERSARADNEPTALFSEQMRAAQYLAHPYGIPVIGWRHEIENLTTADAIAHYRTHYGPDNAVLVVAGDITAAELRPLAEKYYGPIAARGIPARIRPQEPPQLAARRLEMRDARLRQPIWQRSYLAPSYARPEQGDPPALEVLAEIVGGGATSRLYRALVVEQGLASQAGAGYQGDSMDLSSFILYALPREGVTMADLEAALDTVLRDIQQQGITEEELARAKTQLVASAVYAQDSQQTMARIFGANLVVGRDIADVIAWPDNIEAVTAERVQAAAGQLFTPARSVTGLLLPAASPDTASDEPVETAP